jgi:polysaccharide biosynthesis protein PslJ
VTETATHQSDLEPSLVSGRTYATRLRVARVDAAALLSLMVVCISLIPFNLIVPGMTDLGRPGLVIGFLLFAWWMMARFAPHLVMTGPQPIRWALLAFMIASLLSYAAGSMRGLTTMESNGANRVMLFYCVLSGIILTAADGIPNWRRLRGLTFVLVVSAAIVAAIALVQFIFAFNLVEYMTFPGLESKGWAMGFESRGSGYRVASTTTHYIELAAVLALALPFAIHLACFGWRKGRRRVALVCAFLIAAGVGTTISRTGVLAVGLGLLILFPVWTWRMRYNIGMMGVGLMSSLAVASPGMVKTLLHLFDDPESNPAFTVRAARYPLVFHYFAQRPILGRGTGTWIPPQYQILDNQWLVTLASTGVVGVAALAALHITGIVVAGLAWRRAATPEDRHLSAALLSTQVIAIAVAGTFDSLSFSTYAVYMALTLGMCGTVWRLTHPKRTVRTSSPRWFLDKPGTLRR